MLQSFSRTTSRSRAAAAFGFSVSSILNGCVIAMNGVIYTLTGAVKCFIAYSMKVEVVNADRPDSMFLELVPESTFEIAVLKTLLDCPLRLAQGVRAPPNVLTLQIKRDRP